MLISLEKAIEYLAESINAINDTIKILRKNDLTLNNKISNNSFLIKYNFNFHDQIMRKMDDEIKELRKKVEELEEKNPKTNLSG